MANFQTVFYEKDTGQIINIIQNKYISSMHEKLRFCPGYKHEEVNFLYFPGRWPLSLEDNRVEQYDKARPPYVIDSTGLPMISTERRLAFMEIAKQYDTIIVDLADSMGDQLLRVACIIEAQKKYPGHKFFCKVDPQYREVLSLCPDITLFVDYKTHGLDPKKCGHVFMNGGRMYDPRGKGFNKACVYGTWLNLAYVPYNVRLVIPTGFDLLFNGFDKEIDLRSDHHNVVFQFRSKNWEGKCWDVQAAQALSRMIRDVYDCNIYWLGSPEDIRGTYPEFINLCGKTNWIQTVHILTQASHIFCIDSSVQHLSRALDLPYFCLWGETHPQHIMGEDPRPGDFVASFECGPSDIKAWTPLEVFNRAFPEQRIFPPLIYDPAKNTSQHGDQEIIFKYFQEHPPANNILVDVGAYGKDISNTFALLQLGWKGLLIEANPDRMEIIEKDFAGLDVEILNIGIGDKRETLPLYIHKGHGRDMQENDRDVGGTSFLKGWFGHLETGETKQVMIFPLADVLDGKKYPKDFDLLSIDTEGFDEKIMTALFEHSKYRPRLIVTECTSYADAAGLFGKYNYDLVVKTGNPDYGNFIFAKRE